MSFSLRLLRAVRPAVPRPATRLHNARPQCRRGYASDSAPLSVPAAELRFGQPLHETHPHLLKAGDITPNITALEYYERRAKLASVLPTGSVAILAASDVKYASGAVFYKFHQDPDFLYLTGTLCRP
jgi:intermediate cleaving peptidase 55